MPEYTLTEDQRVQLLRAMKAALRPEIRFRAEIIYELHILKNVDKVSDTLGVSSENVRRFYTKWKRSKDVNSLAHYPLIIWVFLETASDLVIAIILYLLIQEQLVYQIEQVLHWSPYIAVLIFILMHLGIKWLIQQSSDHDANEPIKFVSRSILLAIIVASIVSVRLPLPKTLILQAIGDESSNIVVINNELIPPPLVEFKDTNYGLSDKSGVYDEPIYESIVDNPPIAPVGDMAQDDEPIYEIIVDAPPIAPIGEIGQDDEPVYELIVDNPPIAPIGDMGQDDEPENTYNGDVMLNSEGPLAYYPDETNDTSDTSIGGNGSLTDNVIDHVISELDNIGNPSSPENDNQRVDEAPSGNGGRGSTGVIIDDDDTDTGNTGGNSGGNSDGGNSDSGNTGGETGGGSTGTVIDNSSGGGSNGGNGNNGNPPNQGNPGKGNDKDVGNAGETPPGQTGN